jgi:TolB-like protein/Tfp pilus assembly protein PilF
MSSIIEGFNYDIFISYRQKDNKHDGWVTEFVDNLKGELESTFKEQISVYFDINPHDGLLETHDVDASLKEKLRCLLFIPIISRTYCDTKSFAWEHEFKAFMDLASHDHFGLKVKLPNGNVASRVLPVRIHDLDTEDVNLFEGVIGGVMRTLDFVFRTASGVNRPLRAKEDHPNDNLNKTYYQDQINKVSLAIRDIISAIRQNEQKPGEVKKEVIKQISVPLKNNKTKILAGSAIILTLIILSYFLIPLLSDSSKPVEKSIAVLPFINDSPDQENMYFINGIMEEVLHNLQKIKNFRVLSRTSTDQFKGPNKLTIPEIAKKLRVNYLVEGEGQKYGNSYRLRVQLIKAAKEGHLWSASYEKEIRETRDIFDIQSEIAQSIASALKATMTPEEKQLIKKTPTGNLTAYDFYLQGREEYDKWHNGDTAALQKAKDFYHKSLIYDSAFAEAYTGLAKIYWDKHVWKEYFSENFMDSVLILTNIALSFDDHLAETHTLRGDYFSEIGKPERAMEEYDKALKINPNDWRAYSEKGASYYITDYVNWINYLKKAESINRGPELPGLLEQIAWAYLWAGFPEKTTQCIHDKLDLDGDSLSYYSDLTTDEFWLGNFKKSIEYGEKYHAIDSTDKSVLFFLGQDYAWLGQYKESLKYYNKMFKLWKTKGMVPLNMMHRIGYAYWQNGNKEEAKYCFNEQKKYCNKMIELKRSMGQDLWTYYDLAGVYAFMGEKDKAYKNLRVFNQMKKIPLWMMTSFKTDPLFNSIRDESAFQQIVKEMESKYQAEHERVRKWLEEQKMI